METLHRLAVSVWIWLISTFYFGTFWIDVTEEPIMLADNTHTRMTVTVTVWQVTMPLIFIGFAFVSIGIFRRRQKSISLGKVSLIAGTLIVFLPGLAVNKVLSVMAGRPFEFSSMIPAVIFCALNFAAYKMICRLQSPAEQLPINSVPE